METFVVQLWRPADGISGDTDVRGVLRHISTGAEAPFWGGEELLALIRRAAGRPGALLPQLLEELRRDPHATVKTRAKEPT